MTVYVVLILLLGVIAFVLTYKQLGRSDPNYREKSKFQLTVLSTIYLVAIIGSVVALIIYIGVR
ncbi:hypothetical protein MUN88_00415 [Gracilibacillus caseinilyticus]|uniref:Uncharacterized protein n=1 Tax=Gracilibacillus caseinilyticus TaxID=2932256 RepID=A0ABY4EX95_9BACI|nr:hypothetical protein [Gracilibacillus caseinilyticus]UOQ48661.1 hypothetical protein MUN88_00415 [Gracilibacillus caseinilyticus]